MSTTESQRTPQGPPTTRLAPSPTGALHLGNARTFLINAALAHQNGWRVLLRVEDLDTPRVKPGVIDETLSTLAWIGVAWDEGPVIQSHDTARHEEAMRELASRSLVYPCELSRSEIEAAASAPHAGDHETRFDPSLRPSEFPTAFHDSGTNWRLVTDPDPISFHDAFLGTQTHDPGSEVGDFVVWTKRGTPSYQLACALDDAHQGVTHVVRGSDLLSSTARQIHIRRALSLPETIEHTHVPLVRGPDGRRLAKRHGDTRLTHYRAQGVGPERVIGLIAHWCSITDSRSPMDAAEFLERFSLDRLPPDDVTFTQEDDEWLTQP